MRTALSGSQVAVAIGVIVERPPAARVRTPVAYLPVSDADLAGQHEVSTAQPTPELPGLVGLASPTLVLATPEQLRLQSVGVEILWQRPADS
jgi:hypothetical protein